MKYEINPDQMNLEHKVQQNNCLICHFQFRNTNMDTDNINIGMLDAVDIKIQVLCSSKIITLKIISKKS